MAIKQDFFGWAEFIQTPVMGGESSLFDPINQLFKQVLPNAEFKFSRYSTVQSYRFETKNISNTNLGLEITIPSQANMFELYVDYNPTPNKPKGKEWFGIRIRRSNSSIGSAPPIYIRGNIISPAGTEITWKAMEFTTASSVYLEVMLDWEKGELTTWINDKASDTYKFTTAKPPRFSFGSITEVIQSPGNTATCPAWGYKKYGDTMTFSDMYHMIWDGEGEEPSRLGAIICQRLNMDVVELNGTYKNETGESFRTKGFTYTNGNNGVLKDTSKDETTLSLPLALKEGEELVGVTFRSFASENSEDSNTEFVTSVYDGETKLGSVSKGSGKLKGTAMVNKIPPGSGVTVNPVLSESTDLNLRVRFKRP